MSPVESVPDPKNEEKMFDVVGFDYETAYAEHCTHLLDVLTRIVNFLPPNSRVLDIGSGTGKPTAAFFANKGHRVIGLDISQTMADMTVYEPPNGQKFDAVIASHSLYQFSLPALRSQIFKFSRWVKKGGLVAIGTCLKPDEMAEQGRKYDHRGWVERLIERFMGHQAKCTVGLPKAWSGFFEDAGLEILDINQRVCMPEGGAPNNKQDQFFVTGRKIVDHELLGPYPLPKKLSEPFKIVDANIKAWLEFIAKPTGRGDIQEAFDALQREGRKAVLCIGSGSAALARLLRKHCDAINSIDFPGQGALPNLPSNVVVSNYTAKSPPFPNQSFDAIVSFGSLSYSPSPAIAIGELLRVAARDATVILIQAAPDNEFINLMNDTLRDVDISPRAPVHQGILLDLAGKALKNARFDEVTYEYVGRKADQSCQRNAFEGMVREQTGLGGCMWGIIGTVEKAVP
ncbi:hypothetical protein M422DRAFT_51523 [Sphaerobolus stellatus SS14]|uniref:Methyltransferase type 11 domain-containing protein n=1 Tax=Sphaerobolus stellatus (strain SS14) TaxID=990650 RepID=A0A0C9VD28_SPHS4|nr:hypothetical protein M422DRAFT_51523 [Sphaerobolus stellatus SS14]